jgi:ribonuclease D
MDNRTFSNIMAGMFNDISKPTEWICRQQQLDDMAARLAKEETIAVDTESNSLFAYQEQVCLVQFSTHSKDYLVDGLAALDLASLGDIFSSPQIEKVFHAAEYDLICLKRDYGFNFNCLFDTMHAARILGIDKLSLANLLETFFGLQLSKRFQKANWGKRPLPADMVEYARTDTHYLIPLRGKLYGMLSELNLLPLAQEDFQRLCAVQPNYIDVPLYASVSGYHDLEPQTLAILNALCRYRDNQARKLNRPLFKVIGDKALLALVQAMPSTRSELMQVEALSRRLAERHADGLLEAIRTGKQEKPITIERHKRPPQSYLNRLEALRIWRKRAGQKMQVQSDIILPRDILEAIAGRNPTEPHGLKEMMAGVPWRFEHFGTEIMQVLRKG